MFFWLVRRTPTETHPESVGTSKAGPKSQGWEFPSVRESGVERIQGHALVIKLQMHYACPAWLRIRNTRLRFPVQGIQGREILPVIKIH
jgi:hypothetical protein